MDINKMDVKIYFRNESEEFIANLSIINGFGNIFV